MPKYTVKFYKGDYSARQRAANADKAIVYVEHHFNAGSPTADYTCVIVGSNSGGTSRNIGREYARKVASTFGVRIGGVQGLLIGGYNGRGDGNIKHTNMPAVLLEPLFGSNPRHASIIKSEAGRYQLAKILTETIKQFFPNGGLVAFSVGHKYKTSTPNDRGAELYGGGTEADHAEMVLNKAKELLEAL